MISRIKLCIFIMLLISLLGCSTKKSIVGTWQRNDEVNIYNGMQVQVEKLDIGYRGTVVQLNNIAQQDGFVVGDVKWNNIVEVKEDTFDLKDLGKSDGKNTWYDMRMSLDKNTQNKLILRDIASQGEKGAQQVWIRVE